MFVDSHCHLAGAEFAGDLDAVVDRARAAGLTAALVILAADEAAELTQAKAVEQVWPSVRFSIGVHPHAAGKYAQDPLAAAADVDWAIAAQPLTRAVGEIGLDYHYDFSPRDVQQAVFREQIRLAARLSLPIIIHTREATDDTFRILEEEQAARGVFHCFTGDGTMARRAIDAGFHLSFAGILTFPKATELREAARLTPLDRLLAETDAPYLAPVPFRGKRNEPAHVVRVVETLAELHGMPAAEMSRQVVSNFSRLFGLAATRAPGAGA